MSERTITVTQDDADRLAGIAGELEHLPAEIRRVFDQDGRDARYLRLLEKRIRAALATPQQEQARCGGSGVLKAPGGSFDSSAAPCPGCIDCEPDHPVVPEQVEEDGWPAELVIATRPDGFAVNESGPIYPTRRYVLAPTEPSYGGEG